MQKLKVTIILSRYVQAVIAQFFLAIMTLSSFAQAGEFGDAAKGKVIAEAVCLACHNADGNSVISANPILAGQNPNYLFKQLQDFKGKDGKPASRANGVMAGMVAALTVDDMKNVAAWYSSQTLKPMQAKDAKLVDLGKKLWRGGDVKRKIAACAGCHGPSGAGLPIQYPRLAGQHQDYTAQQLKTFRNGERANDENEMMRSIAAKLTDAEITALADYIAGLR